MQKERIVSIIRWQGEKNIAIVGIRDLVLTLIGFREPFQKRDCRREGQTAQKHRACAACMCCRWPGWEWGVGV